MLANVRKSQYESEGWIYNSTYYVVEAELELEPEELHTLQRAGVLDKIIFDSANVDYYGNATAESLESAGQSASNIGYQEIFDTGDKQANLFTNAIASFYTSLWYIGQGTYHLGASAYNAIQWNTAFQLSVRGLLEGTKFESESHDEVLEAERIIRQSIDALKTHFLNLTTFDAQDNLIEPE